MTDSEAVIRGVEVIGPYRGTTGHDRHTREFTRQLVRRGVSVQLTALPGWSPVPPNATREAWLDELGSKKETDLALHFTMPTLCRPRAGKINVNYTMFEADRIPREWVHAAAPHARIIVPTRSSFDAWTAGGIAEKKLRIVPLGVDAVFFGEPAPPLPIVLPNGRALSSYAHRFLNIGDLRPRKNHLGLLRAWTRATNRDDDAVLIVKVSAAHPRSLQLFQADIARMQQRLGRSLHDAAPVVFLIHPLAEDELRSLYRSATHYFSMSCGEGWDFPMIESAVAGLQLIAPRHSAYLEYLGEDDAVWIPAARVPAIIECLAGAEDRRWFDGACWWRPDEDAAIAALRRILNGSPPTRSPRDRITRDFGWENAGARLHEVLEELLS